MRYRITKHFSPQRFGLMWLAIAGTVGVAILISVVFHIATANIIIVPGLYLAGRWYVLANTALMVDRSGMRVGDLDVPWEPITQLVISRGSPAEEVRVGVRLRPDAAVAPEAPSSTHPGDPQVQGMVPGEKLNVSRLRAKVRGFAPQVQVTELPDGAGALPATGTP